MRFSLQETLSYFSLLVRVAFRACMRKDSFADFTELLREATHKATYMQKPEWCSWSLERIEEAIVFFVRNFAEASNGLSEEQIQKLIAHPRCRRIILDSLTLPMSELVYAQKNSALANRYNELCEEFVAILNTI